MREILIRTLREAGQQAHEHRAPDGSVLVVLPHGGRILGLYGPRVDENFFWTSPELGTVDSARRFFASDGWHNTGGDRTWLAPEIDFFLPDFPKPGPYVQPRGLDAGVFTVEARGARLAMTGLVPATLSRPRLDVMVEIRKEVGPAPDPLRHERRAPPSASLEYAGYTLRTTARFLGPPAAESAWVGAWNLLQLPHGGKMIIPTYGRTEPRVYFGQATGDDLRVDEGQVAWWMRSRGEHKIGVRAAATCGRVGYAYRARERCCLVIRNFFVGPSGEYVDVPVDAPQAVGDAFQACNIDSALGSFSELEHHAPAVRGPSGEASEDLSQLWAYRGSLEDIREVAARLLGTRGSPFEQ